MSVTFKLKSSTVANVVPTTAQLTPGEIAINRADGKLFYVNSAGAVSSLQTNPLPTGGTTGQVLTKKTNTNGDVEWTTIPATDVRGTALTGFTVPTAAAVTATDTVLSGFGKLQAQVNASAPLASPTVTSLRERSVALAASTVIQVDAGNFFTKTITAATTLTATGWPASGVAFTGVLELTNGGAGVITFPTGSKFVGGTQPALTASGKDVLGFYSIDGGTTINWFVIGINVL